MKLSDEQLIKGCLNGDKKAQRALYEQYKVMLFGVCLRYGNDRAEAEDLLQEGFIKIYSDLYQYRPKSALGAWMRRVVVNVALQHIRKKKNHFKTVEIEQIADSYEADDAVFSSMRAKALIRMVQQLPDGYRTVFNLYAIEGYSHKEIAEKLDITVNTSKSQLSRAKSVLRKMIERSLIS